MAVEIARKSSDLVRKTDKKLTNSRGTKPLNKNEKSKDSVESEKAGKRQQESPSH